MKCFSNCNWSCCWFYRECCGCCDGMRARNGAEKSVFGLRCLNRLTDAVDTESGITTGRRAGEEPGPVTKYETRRFYF